MSTAIHAKHVAELDAIREGLIARAVTARKIAPEKADDYRRMFDTSPFGVAHLLTASVERGGLMAGLAMHENPLPPPVTDYPREWFGLDAHHAGGAIGFEDAQSLTAGYSTALPPQTEREHVRAQYVTERPVIEQGLTPPQVVGGQITIEPGCSVP